MLRILSGFMGVQYTLKRYKMGEKVICLVVDLSPDIQAKSHALYCDAISYCFVLRWLILSV